MKQFKVFITEENGHTVHIENGVAVSNAARKPLPNNPDGWQDIGIGWERNMTLHGIIRNFSLALGFVRDGAHVLRKTFYSENVERKLSLLITMLYLKLTPTKFAFNYKFLYKGDLDFSTLQDEANKVSINIMEGGITKMLNANKGTMYGIPFKDDPDAKDLYCDGIELKQSVNYGATDELLYETTGAAIDMPILTTEGKSGEIKNFKQVWVNVNLADFDHYRHNSDNYFIINTGRTPVLAKLKGKVFLRCNSVSWNLGLNSKRVYLKVISNVDGSFEDSTFIYDPNVGETYEIDIDLVVNLDGTKDQKYFFMLQVGETPSEAENIDFEFLAGSEVTCSFFSRYPPSYVKFWTLYDYYRKLTGKVTGNQEDAVSSLLLENLNYGITCGDAIRGFVDADGKSTAILKSKMSDFFEAVNVELNSGASVEGNKLLLESKARYYDNSNPIPLGEVRQRPTVKYATDLMANTFRFGSAPQTYNEINGREEFNTQALFSSPITRVVKEFNLESPYRRDCYGFEDTRINFDGKETTDSDNDNDVWIVNVAKDQSHWELLFPAFTSFESTAPNLLKLPGAFLPVGDQIQITGGPYNNGVYTVLGLSYVLTDYTLVTVLEPVTTQTGGTQNSGAVYTTVVEPYVLKRGTYDSITGLISPDSVFNLEDMTIQRLIKKHGNWIRSMMHGFDDNVMPFEISDKNYKLKTVQGSVVYDESADIVIHDLAAPLFIPKYFEIELKVPVNLPELLENNPNRCFSFTWQGLVFKGFLIKAGISLSDNAQQVFKLLSAPDNDFSKLID